MADKSAPSQYRRAADLVQGIGANLESIQNTDVLLKAFSIQERPMRGETRTFVKLSIAKDINKPEVATDFHAWSDSLAEKLGELPDDSLPLLIKFVRVATSGGFRVWTFE